MEQFRGKYLNIKCKNGDTYQGRILDVSKSHLKIDKACYNGIPTSTTDASASILELPVALIQNLDIIEAPSNGARHAEATTSSSTFKGKVERPVAVRAPTGAEVGASPRKLEASQNNRKDRQTQMKARNAEAFGTPVDTMMVQEFDFEKNLALFDKKAVYDEINASKPDLVRQVGKNNYRCDEHVLPKQAIMLKQIRVENQDRYEYVTDTGLLVPSIKTKLRKRILELAEEAGLTFLRQSELVGRAATETALQLLGGAHRLNPQNQHQCPSVAVLCGVHRAGLQAANAARQLSSHGVRVIVYVDHSTITPSAFSQLMVQELSLLQQSNVKITNHVQDLCTAPVDLIVLALADADILSKGPATAATRWAENNRASILGIDPPPMGYQGVTSKCSLVSGLPLALEPPNGHVYLCNIGIPIGVYKAAGVDYLPPFGPKFVISLHPNV